MKFIYLPPKSILTKKNELRKGRRSKARLFFEDGRELTDISSFTLEGGGYLGVTVLRVEFVDPQIERIMKAPKEQR